MTQEDILVERHFHESVLTGLKNLIIDLALEYYPFRLADLRANVQSRYHLSAYMGEKKLTFGHKTTSYSVPLDFLYCLVDLCEQGVLRIVYTAGNDIVKDPSESDFVVAITPKIEWYIRRN